jgi:DNA-binding transcriptional LysR family regulator
MDHRHLRFFVAVAEELHFTRAANRLRVAQPHLSQEIRRLERELDVELFVRTKRSVALTPAGQVFLDRVRVVFDATADAVQAAQRASRGEIGRLLVGIVSTPAYGVIPGAFAQFRRAYPHVELVLSEYNSEAGLEAVRTGRLDLCLLHPPRSVEPALNVETLWLEPLVVVLPQKHALAGLKRISLQRLRSEPWVLWRRELASRLYDEIVGACTASGFEPRVAQRTMRLTTVVSLVASGMGVGLIPITIAQLGIGGAIYRHLRPPSVKVPLSFVWQRGQSPPALAPFMTVVRDWVAAYHRGNNGRNVPLKPRT